ncbi:glutathione S-transferase family protein [Roseibium sp. SCP14]|uniref:glutathione S-transferase family protein n=1 Tax=Roseibium sp. SCP14 TaxID=3141375 RepID=UPI00333A12B7
MNTLYLWDTPNGHKPAIMLEELGEPWNLVPVDISKGTQFSADFVKINPNSKIPAFVDDDVVLFESGAILQYLAEKHRRFLAPSGQERATALSWCYWQAGGLGPMLGQWGHFVFIDERHPYAIERYLTETIRLYEVLEQRLSEVPYLAGDEYSIADMMSFPWVKSGNSYLKNEKYQAADRLPHLPNLDRWIDKIDSRPAVKAALERVTNETGSASGDG